MKTIFNNLLVLEEGGNEILSLADTKKFLKISGSVDDEQISSCIKQAIRFAENFCGISLVEKLYIVTYDANSIKNNKIFLPISRVNFIYQISTINHNGEEFYLDDSYYYFEFDTQILFLKNSLNGELIKIQFTTYIDEKKIEEFKTPLLQHINLLYKRRLPSMNQKNFDSEIEIIYRNYKLFGL